MMVQKHSEEIARALLVPISESVASPLPSASTRAGRYLAFDGSGNPVASAGPGGDSAIPVSAYIETLLDDADAATARATLGLVVGTDILAPDGDGTGLSGIASVPTGAVLPHAGASAPSGFVLCDGSAISRATYAGLFAEIGTTYGAGDGSTTFNVPDLRGRVPLGAGTGDAADATAHALADKSGAETHTLTISEMPSHAHPNTAGSNTFSSTDDAGNTLQGGSVVAGPGTSGSTGSGGAHNNLPPFLTLNFIVKT